jgi:hypothetical protein
MYNLLIQSDMKGINYKNKTGKRFCPMATLSVYLILAVCAISFAACHKDDAPAISEFSFAGQRGVAVIDKDKHTVKAIAECGTSIAALSPDFKLSPAATTAMANGKAQISGTTVLDFSVPVVYLLTSPDGKTVEYTVSITLPDDCPSAKLKAATIQYIDRNGNKHYLCFDNYGKQRRWEGINQDGNQGIFIYDEINGKYHVWSNDPNSPGWVPDQYVTANTTSSITAVYLSETHQYAYTYWELIPGATKTTETIAGQSCTVYTIPADNVTAIFGVWANTVLLRMSDGDGGILEAVSAKQSCPANAFTKMVAINWE